MSKTRDSTENICVNMSFFDFLQQISLPLASDKALDQNSLKIVHFKAGLRFTGLSPGSTPNYSQQ